MERLTHNEVARIFGITTRRLELYRLSGQIRLTRYYGGLRRNTPHYLRSEVEREAARFKPEPEYSLSARTRGPSFRDAKRAALGTGGAP
jgi:hypothetical protein